MEAFRTYPRVLINRTWLTLQSCLNEIIEKHGGNNYKIPHMSKERLEREGQLPTVLPVTQRLEEILEHNQEDNEDNIEESEDILGDDYEELLGDKHEEIEDNEEEQRNEDV